MQTPRLRVILSYRGVPIGTSEPYLVRRASVLVGKLDSFDYFEVIEPELRELVNRDEQPIEVADEHGVNIPTRGVELRRDLSDESYISLLIWLSDDLANQLARAPMWPPTEESGSGTPE